MSKPLTPAQARELVRDLRATAAQRRRVGELEALALEEQAALIEDEIRRGLTISAERGRLRHRMQAPALSRPRRDVGRKPKLDTPFRKWLHDTDQTVEEYAARKRLKPSTVKSWTIRGQKKGGRPIPRANADDIQAEAGQDEHGDWRVPATNASWPNGIN